MDFSLSVSQGEVILPEDFLGARLCTLDEYATWMSSENRAWLVRHLGITEVAEMDKNKEAGVIVEDIRRLVEVGILSPGQARAEVIRHLGLDRVVLMEDKTVNAFGIQKTAQELAQEASKQFGTSIGVGTQVRDAVSKEYLGKVVRIETVVYADIETRDGDHARANVARLEVAPKLTPEEAWVQLPQDIVKRLVDLKPFPGMMSGFTYTALRRDCYILLGGAGVKITEDVKERVRKIIETLAGHLDIRII